MTIISIVSYPFLPAKLGGQKGIALFYNYFSQHCRLICVTTKKNDPGAARGYTVVNTISNSPLRYINIFLFFKLRKKIKQENATHLLLEHPYYGWLAILLKRSCGVKLVVHSHNIESLRWKSVGKWWWPILSYYENITHRAADYSFFKQENDQAYALSAFKLEPATTSVITYGIDWQSAPSELERIRCKSALMDQYKLTFNTTLFLFNGTLDYMPNLKAVKTILGQINPLLMQAGFAYKIIICGKGLPAELNELREYSGQNIIYAGFVDDISVYFKGADVFINPVNDGGGIKTKLVEALAYNMNAVTTKSGAIGIPERLTGDKMIILEDEDWKGFANAMLHQQPVSGNIPAAFFEHFFWGNIAAKAAAFIEH